MFKYVTETTIIPIVTTTCDRLDLPSDDYKEICKELVQGKLLSDITWLAKVHIESVARKVKGELRFGDKLCEEINWCQKWLDPQKLKEKAATESMDMVFF